MKFCEKCDNMMYFSVTPADSADKGSGTSSKLNLQMMCRNCNFHSTIKDTINEPVFTTELRDDLVNYKRHSVADLKYDPTMPRLANYPCTNDKTKSCRRKPATSTNILYMKYDATNMKYMFFCCDCNVFWKASDDNLDGVPN